MLAFRQNSYQPALNQQGALAEWLTRGPAKLISSEACVRITQASIHNLFNFCPADRTPNRAEKERQPNHAANGGRQPTRTRLKRVGEPNVNRSIESILYNLFCHIASSTNLTPSADNTTQPRQPSR
jgi:hypothetical protein